MNQYYKTKIKVETTRSMDTFISYIYKVLKQVHPNIGMTKDAKEYTNKLIHKLLDELFREITIIMGKKKTISAKEVEKAVQLLIISRHGLSEGYKALSKYKAAEQGREGKKLGRENQSALAGLTFPIPRVTKKIRQAFPKNRVGKYSSIFLTAVLEYITAEILEVAGNISLDESKKRITTDYIKKGINNDKELTNIFSRIGI